MAYAYTKHALALVHPRTHAASLPVCLSCMPRGCGFSSIHALCARLHLPGVQSVV